MGGPPPRMAKEIEALEMRRRQGIRRDKEEVNIQRVPRYLEGMGFEKYFIPQFISFGPFHYDKPYVSIGERYKWKWTAMYLVDTNQHQQHSYDALFDRIDNVPQVSVLLTDEYGKWEWIMDGCSILQVLEKSYDDLDIDLDVSTPQLVRVYQDMLLLENQVPFKLLKLICNDNTKLNRCLRNFLKTHGVMFTGTHDLVLETDAHHLIMVDEAERNTPIHLLDYLRRALLIKTSRYAVADLPHYQVLQQLQQQADLFNFSNRSLYLRKYRISSVRELKNTGIRVQKLSHDNDLHPIFNSDSSTLQLPKLIVDGSTMLIFLNLIAYEMCPDFHDDFDITSYVVFLSSLIETPEDVKELRSCGVLINDLASDKEVSDFFNRMDTLLVPETPTYANINYQIQKHFESHRSKIKMLGWMGEAYSSFLRSPWTVIALLAATLGLTLTFIQTWFAIHPKGS